MNEMSAHAVETIPEECCGLILGKESGDYASVHRCRNDMTLQHELDPSAFPRDGREAFFMNPHDYVRVSQMAEANGECVVAVYHSHVGYGAYFSEMDQVFVEQPGFPFPEADHIVLSVMGNRVVELGRFGREGPGRELRGRAVIVELP